MQPFLTIRQSESLKVFFFGNGKFIAIGRGYDPGSPVYGLIRTSTDGKNWDYQKLGLHSSFEGGAYGNGTYVVVGTDIFTSPDGVTWTPNNSGLTENILKSIKSIAYGMGLFVSVGRFGAILTSSDGITWTLRSSGTNTDFIDVAFGNGIFVIVGQDGTILTSSYGANWTRQNLRTTVPLSGVTYGSGMFVTVGHGTILSSPDGVNWTVQRAGTDFNLRGITYGNDRFVYVGENGTIFTSSNGINWTAGNSGIILNLNAVAHGNGMFVTAGDFFTVMTSYDGINWSIRTSEYYLTKGHISELIEHALKWLIGVPYAYALSSDCANDYYFGVTYGNGTFVVVGWGAGADRYPCNYYGAILASTDGVSWIGHRLGSEGLRGVTYGKDMFVAVGDGGTIGLSRDGVNWEQTSFTSYPIYNVAYGNGTFVAVGTGRIWTSPDGKNWTLRSSGTNQDLFAITFENGIFVAVGTYGTILTSPDGLTWTVRNSGTTQNLHGVAYGSNTFMVVGDNGIVLQSDSLIDIPPVPINNPPSAPTLVYPANTQAGLSTPVTFIWKKSSDPDGDPVTYNLHVCEDQSFAGCSPVQIASVDKEKVIYAGMGVWHATGLFLFGIVISLRLQKRKVLLLFAMILTALTLFISCGGGGGGSRTSPTDGGPPPIGSDELSQTVSGLKSGTTYFWKVVADDGKNGITESGIRSLSTK